MFSIGQQHITCGALGLLPTGYRHKIYNFVMPSLLLLEGGYSMWFFAPIFYLYALRKSSLCFVDGILILSCVPIYN